ncbi:hypothetical protein AGMMS50229_20880 [Campylobacterota bacterium]|nr:hypothetical protein AGMMS50229_20880 [Campylobacterota bacterium]
MYANDIAKASNEQALQQIDAVTQQNTASAEETASVSNEMNSHASALQKVMTRFKLRRNTAGVSTGMSNMSALAVKKPARKTAAQSEDNWGNEPVAAGAGNDYNFKLDDSEFGKF